VTEKGRRFVLDRNDLGLLLVVLTWGLNLTVVKFAFLEIRPLAFNGVRFTAAAVALVILLRWQEGTTRIGGRDALWMAVLGLVGHAIYQTLFIQGIARTTASHAALIFGVTPVAVAVLSLLAGHERLNAARWAGAALAFAGVYVIISGRPPADGPAPTLWGDLMILGAALCWCVYTVLAKPILERHSPLKVTALSMAWGAAFLVPLCAMEVSRQDWTRVSLKGWALTVYAFLFPLVLAYVLWYRSVRKVGSVRTSVYSNLVPVTGTLTAWLLLDERLYPALGLGAAAILGGIALTRSFPPAAKAGRAEIPAIGGE
jgi:drug/metabolite transporter (DMT)-like permease